jgi:hypothetical protein
LQRPMRFFRDSASMKDNRKAEAVAAARHEIAMRIARFCTSLSPEEFDALLDRMAKVQWKYEVMPVKSYPAEVEPQPRELLE